jgi:hypothetical protein
LFTGLATLTRLPGVCLALAFLVVLASRRRWRSAGEYGVTVFALVAPWFLWAQAQVVPSDLGYYSSSNYVDWNTLVDPRWSEMALVLAGNARYLLVAPAHMMGLVLRSSYGTGTIFLALLLSAIVLTGLAAALRGRLGVLPTFALVYGLMMLLWPWPPARFVAPFYPLVLLFGWRGLSLLSSLLPWRVVRHIRVAAVAALAFVSVWALTSVSRQAAQTGTVWPHPACNGDWSEFQAVFRWINESTPSDAILAGNLDPLLYLYTGRRAVRAFEADPVALYYSTEPTREPLGPPEALADRLLATGADYLVMTPGACFHERHFLKLQIAALLEGDDALLRQVARYSDESRIYEVRKQR